MKRLRVDEPEAFRWLRQLASDHKVAELAGTILGADEVFQALEKV